MNNNNFIKFKTISNQEFIFTDKKELPPGENCELIESEDTNYFGNIINQITRAKSSDGRNLHHVFGLIKSESTGRMTLSAGYIIESIVKALISKKLYLYHVKPEKQLFEEVEAPAPVKRKPRKQQKKPPAKKEPAENQCTSKSGSVSGSSVPPTDKTPVAGDPVSLINGEELLQLTDFTVPGPMPIVWKRTYRTTRANVDNGLGFGWHTIFDSELIISNDEIILIDEDGRSIPFPPVLPEGESKQPSENLILRRDSRNEYTLMKTNKIHHVFKKQGERYRITSISEPCGNAIEMIYTEKGNISRIDNRAGRCIYVERYKSGHIRSLAAGLVDEKTKKAEPLKHTYINYEYDESENLIAVTDPCGGKEQYHYHNHILVTRTLKSGYKITLEWDEYTPQGKCIKQYGDDGYYNYSFEYIPKLNRTRCTDSRGISSTYIYNGKGMLVEKVDGKRGTIKTIFDENGRIIEEIDQNGYSRYMEYDNSGKLAQTEEKDGATTLYLYNEIDDPVKLIDPCGGVWEKKFDAFGNIIKLTDPLGRSTIYEYNLNGTIKRIIDPEGNERKLIWNEFGDFVGDWNVKTNTLEEYLYDNLGRMTHSITADGELTRYEYDAVGRITQIAIGVKLENYETPLNEIDGNIIRHKFSYDIAGRLTKYTDPENNIHLYKYDGLSQIRAKIAPDGSEFQYNYDAERNLNELVNENGEHLKFAYDENENISSETGFDNSRHKYRYNAAGHLIYSKCGQFLETDYQRDQEGRLLKKVSTNTKTGEELICEYRYDDLGRMIAANNKERDLTFKYDAVGNLTEEWQDKFCIKHRYDKNNNRIETQLPDGNRIAYRYNHNNICTEVLFNKRVITKIERDTQGREKEIQHGNDITSSNSHDPFGRLSKQMVYNKNNGEQPFIERSFEYDYCGNLKRLQNINSEITEYQYDGNGRIKSANGIIEEQFSFDLAGNIIGENSQLKGNRLNRDNNYRYEYDDAGNLTKKISTEDERKQLIFEFNAENQLVKTSRFGMSTKYKYDALGRRIEKRDEVSQKTFYWNQDVLLLEQRDNSKKLYLFEPDTFRPLAQILRHDIYYYHLDHLGTPKELTNNKGDIVWQANYSAYGQIIKTEVNDIQNNLRFQGQYFDKETGLHYNRHRYYDPATGRYISQDPIGILGGRNQYSYCKNPTGYIDPLGLSPEKESPDRAQKAQEKKQNPATDGKGESDVFEENSDTHSVSTNGEVKAKQPEPPAPPASGAAENCVTCDQIYWIEYNVFDSVGHPVEGVKYLFADTEETEDKDRLKSDGTIKRKRLAKSGECNTILQYVHNAQWSQEEARSGDIVKLTAEAIGFEDGQEAVISIYEMDHDRNDDLVEEIKVKVENEKIRAQWEYYFVNDEDHEEEEKEDSKEFYNFRNHIKKTHTNLKATIKDISGLFNLEISMPDDVNPNITEGDMEAFKEQKKYSYHYPEFYFVVKALEEKSQSPLLSYKDWVEFTITDNDGKPCAGMEYTMYFSDYRQRCGKLDDSGTAREDDIPPGKYRLHLHELEKDTVIAKTAADTQSEVTATTIEQPAGTTDEITATTIEQPVETPQEVTATTIEQPVGTPKDSTGTAAKTATATAAATAATSAIASNTAPKESSPAKKEPTTQATAPVAAAAPAPEKPKVLCTVDTLTVTCGHDSKGKRTVTNGGVLEIVPDSGNIREDAVKYNLFGVGLELKVAHKGTDEVKADMTTKNGSDRQQLSWSSFPTTQNWKNGNKQSWKYDALSNSDLWPWPSNTIAETTYIAARGCDDATHQVTVKQFPSQQYSLAISKEFKPEDKETLDDKIMEIIKNSVKGYNPFKWDIERVYPSGSVEFAWGWKEDAESSRAYFAAGITAGAKPLTGFSLWAKCSLLKVFMLIGMPGLPGWAYELTTEMLGDINIGAEVKGTLSLTGNMQLQVYSNREKKVQGGANLGAEGALKFFVEARLGSEWVACAILSGAASGSISGSTAFGADSDGISVKPEFKLNPIVFEVQLCFITVKQKAYEGTHTWRIWDGTDLIEFEKKCFPGKK